MAKTSKKAQSWVSAKIHKIGKEGLRGKPGSAVSQKQKVAVALSMAREKGFKIPGKGKGNPHINDSPDYQGPGYHEAAQGGFSRNVKEANTYEEYNL